MEVICNLALGALNDDIYQLKSYAYSTFLYAVVVSLKIIKKDGMDITQA